MFASPKIPMVSHLSFISYVSISFAYLYNEE